MTPFNPTRRGSIGASPPLTPHTRFLLSTWKTEMIERGKEGDSWTDTANEENSITLEGGLSKKEVLRANLILKFVYRKVKLSIPFSLSFFFPYFNLPLGFCLYKF